MPSVPAGRPMPGDVHGLIAPEDAGRLDLVGASRQTCWTSSTRSPICSPAPDSTSRMRDSPIDGRLDQSKAAPQIEDRDELAPDADDADHRGRRSRDLRDRRRPEDLGELRDAHRVRLAGEPEREVLGPLAGLARAPRRAPSGPVFDEQGHRDQDLAPSTAAQEARLAWDEHLFDEAATSRTSATRWSPSSVAPAKPRTAFSDLPSALMTMSADRRARRPRSRAGDLPTCAMTTKARDRARLTALHARRGASRRQSGQRRAADASAPRATPPCGPGLGRARWPPRRWPAARRRAARRSRPAAR